MLKDQGQERLAEGEEVVFRPRREMRCQKCAKSRYRWHTGLSRVHCPVLEAGKCLLSSKFPTGAAQASDFWLLPWLLLLLCSCCCYLLLLGLCLDPLQLVSTTPKSNWTYQTPTPWGTHWVDLDATWGYWEGYEHRAPGETAVKSNIYFNSEKVGGGN